MTPYAELQTLSNYTFLEGASHADELAITASALGLEAIAICDRNTLSGIVRAHVAAKAAGIRLVVGARLDLTDGASLLCFPTDRAAYGRLSRLLTLGRRRAPKGECHLARADVAEHAEGQILVLIAPDPLEEGFAAQLAEWRTVVGDRLYLAATRRFRGDDGERLRVLAGFGIPLVATNDVLYHTPARRPLADVLTCIRQGTTLAAAGWALSAHGERHLKSPAEMARLFAACPEALANGLEVVRRCRFSLDELAYEYPNEVAAGMDPQERLEILTRQGAARRYPRGVPPKVQAQLAHELALIRQLGFAPYFLTVHAIVAFAESRGILCQGRGSAANSAVCYCLRVTPVDPAQMDLLFERFISAERGEPPDIDVDFEHERREEVIQHIYDTYGRHRAGLTATVIHYRTRSAIRDVGKVMGLSEDTVEALAKANSGWGRRGIKDEHVRELGLDPTEPGLARTLSLAEELTGFPRHLSQHVGGFVISKGRLDELVPIENAGMEDRTVIQWDKDDLDALGLMKVDVLALGMLSCIRKAFDLLRLHHGRDLCLATLPREDASTYDMLCKADAVGVFQVESRAQMSMLPRLRPRRFYDLVVEVAIVRPGPIQGGMVHPYLRRRQGKETVDYPSEELRQVLGKTLGVPLFQEQAMKIAMVAAGFTASEADGLRRAMATFRHTGQVGAYGDKLIGGMVARGYERDFAERVFKQIEGFGEYGFPESHAAAFAHLVYVSAWLKCHYPAAFACALLNSQPMGFYAPAQIVRDAADHGVEIRPVDVNHSDWDCTLEGKALRLGLRQVSGLARRDGERLAAARGAGYASAYGLWRTSGLERAALDRLAAADAFGSMGLGRREAAWAIKALDAPPLPLFEEAPPPPEAKVALPPASVGEEVVGDYAALKLSLKCHPLAVLRDPFRVLGIMTNASLKDRKGGRVAVSGLVLVRQRPGSANGVLFITLEDETGIANIVVWPDMFETFRRPILGGHLLRVDGRVQSEDGVIHVVAEKIEDLSAHLGALARGSHYPSRDFR
ncbi:error-prone DNA polymerase [Paramagnetospirillum magneticum]|uniref:Error-prone DNA polymerase n=1 Tax=Paramagnetospirillum magneticum (strain ATCC 700264 / AMB-1) TaxID=342108 RepID=Q2W2X1_PARM1|nr:error-prone DNA polymerase [Paramagnetospirillum magneticum]BAE51804.1 DNA polymerase III, alpha subunit [Paramagnetospirillum magneticum AMB-1]